MDKDKEWRLKNKEHIKAYRKAYRKKYRKILNLKAKLFMRNYRKTKEGKDTTKTYGKKRKEWLRENRPWQLWHFNTMTRCNSPSSHYYRKGIKYELTLDQIKTLWFRDKAYLLKQPSIDRINTPGNYTLDNTRFIELSENLKRAKGKYHEQNYL